MENKSFDTALVHKVNIITQRNPDHSSFEWFAVGYLYAHPNNTQTLENVFTNVHTVVKLSRTSPLTLDDTTDILIKMINNLMRPTMNV